MKDNLTNILQRKKAILMGLFISKYSQRALDNFGFSTYKEAYNVFGYSVKYPPSSIKNYQQEFDRFFPNGRTGWQRPVRDYCLEIFNQYKDMPFDDFCKLINSTILDEYVDILFFDPIHCGNLTFQRTTKQIQQVEYKTNIIEQ